MSILGIDIGGTKIAAGILDGPGRALRGATRIPTPRLGAESILSAVEELIAGMRADHPDITAIGIGAPGLVEPVSGRVLAASEIVPGWQGAEVGGRLRRATGLPVEVDNDVRAMAGAEAAFGAGSELGRVLYLSVGTGVGGALGSSGRLVRGARGSAGEIAHLTTPVHGPIPCGCGAFDHLESILAGPALEAAYAEETGQALPLREIAERVREDGGGAELPATLIYEAGRVLGGFASALDLDAIVLAGGVARTGALLIDPLRRGLAASSWPRGRELPIVPARLGDDAAVIGAALLARSAAASAADPARAEPCSPGAVPRDPGEGRDPDAMARDPRWDRSPNAVPHDPRWDRGPHDPDDDPGPDGDARTEPATRNDNEQGEHSR